MRRALVLSVLALAVAAVRPAGAFPPAPWDGTEPREFTHYVDRNRDGICDNLDLRPGADQVRVVANGTYPDCRIRSGRSQVAHGHWEYTHAQGNPQHHGGDTEEKDYADFDVTDPSGISGALTQTYRFFNQEPTRFLRLFSGPMRYWQVDEWIGPRAYGDRAPGATWNERFYVCTGPCTAAGHTGGYWSDQFDDSPFPVECYKAGRRTTQCGMQG